MDCINKALKIYHRMILINKPKEDRVKQLLFIRGLIKAERVWLEEQSKQLSWFEDEAGRLASLSLKTTTKN